MIFSQLVLRRCTFKSIGNGPIAILHFEERMFISGTPGLYSEHLGTRKDCPDYRGVLISEVEDVLYGKV